MLIHTGGTIGMKATETGFAPGSGIVESYVETLLHSGEAADVTIHTLNPIIDSANATPQDWNRIICTIQKEYDNYDAFIVTHGTDTMAYCAAALCFAIEGLSKPIIITGSMIPLSTPNSDGKRNLLDALTEARSAPAGVWVQFAGKLLHGGRVRKSHSHHLDGFAASLTDMPPQRRASALQFKTYEDRDVAVLAFAPGISIRVFELALGTCDGVVLRCYGSGTAPKNIGLADALRVAEKRRIPVIAVSQCPEGGMALGTYAAGAVLRDGGVIDGCDMTVEAAYVKMLYTLSCVDQLDQQTKLLAQRLCGEFVQHS